MLIRCVERGESALRCAWCHDPLDGGLSCEGCGTRLHPSCQSLASGCPTLGCEWATQRPSRRARLFVHLREREDPHRGRYRRLFLGVVFPLICFGCAEAGFTDLLTPEWNDGSPSSFWKLFYHRETLRWFYPLLAWSLIAFVQAERGQRGPWLRTGLGGGVVLSAIFSLAFVPAIPFALVAVAVFGLGLLGLGPFVALHQYFRAWGRVKKPDAEPDGAAYVPRHVWLTLGLLGASGAVRTMNHLHELLPTHPPDCYIATVAARGAPALVRPTEERFDDGDRRPISRQLRTFKAAELVLRALAPRTHGALRAGYDRLGPPLARRMGPTSATAAYLMLLPLQVLAGLGLRLLLRNAGRVIDRTYAGRR